MSLPKESHDVFYGHISIWVSLKIVILNPLDYYHIPDQNSHFGVDHMFSHTHINLDLWMGGSNQVRAVIQTPPAMERRNAYHCNSLWPSSIIEATKWCHPWSDPRAESETRNPRNSYVGSILRHYYLYWFVWCIYIYMVVLIIAMFNICLESSAEIWSRVSIRTLPDEESDKSTSKSDR